MKRTIQALLALVVALSMVVAIAPGQSEAARGWCTADPVVLIDGQLADIFVSSDPSMLTSANGPIKMEITIPTGSTGTVVLRDLGFLHGYSITWKYSSSLRHTTAHTQVQVRVYAPSRMTLPVTVTFAPRSLSSGLLAVLIGQSASGQSNSWVSLKTS
jgi:hypothetical protein